MKEKTFVPSFKANNPRIQPKPRRGISTNSPLIPALRKQHESVKEKQSASMKWMHRITKLIIFFAVFMNTYFKWARSELFTADAEETTVLITIIKTNVFTWKWEKRQKFSRLNKYPHFPSLLAEKCLESVFKRQIYKV